jgi:HK97 family phage prohead protease
MSAFIAVKEDQKQVRTYKKIEAEFRAAEDGTQTLIGLIPYNRRSVDMGFYEIIKPSAFQKTLSDRTNVLALHNHDASKVLGATRSKTLRLIDTEAGLRCEVDLPSTTYAKDLAEVVRRGDVVTMSFGFYAIKDNVYVDDNGDYIRDLYEAKLEEVSFGVAFPAYEDTTSEVRAANRDYIQERIKEAEKSEPPASTPDEESDLVKSRDFSWKARKIRAHNNILRRLQ